MKKIFYFLIIKIILSNNLFAEIKLTNILENLRSPWSLSLIDNNNYLISEKSGNILLFNKSTGELKKIKHNLKVLEHGQGGLLDILYYKNKIIVSYSEDNGNFKTTTSAAIANFNKDTLYFKNIFKAQPPINSKYHFGSRLIIKNNYLYLSAGERGEGKIAQNPNKHPGSIIRINLDGSIPKDNPKFLNKPDWLPEIYQIGIRNVQGMCLSPFNNEIYITNHGAKGGDWFGKVLFGGNYGWDTLYWGGTKYSGLTGGPKWLPGFDKPIKYYVPSIAISACLIYNGDEFPEWNGNALITSLKDQSLRKINFIKNKFIKEKIILKDKIGRLRDIKIDSNGKLLLLTDQGSLWLLSKK